MDTAHWITTISVRFGQVIYVWMKRPRYDGDCRKVRYRTQDLRYGTKSPALIVGRSIHYATETSLKKDAREANFYNDRQSKHKATGWTVSSGTMLSTSSDTSPEDQQFWGSLI